MMKWQPRKKGVALQYLGRHANALAAFASGLAQDPKSLQLLVGMVEAAMKSPMRKSGDAELQLQEYHSLRQELEEAFAQIRAYQEQFGKLQQEVKNLKKEQFQAKEHFIQKSKELKNAQDHKKMVIEELVYIKQEITELQSEKEKLAHQLRENEEEVHMMKKTIQHLKQELSSSEKSNTEVQVHTESTVVEDSKYMKLEEESQPYTIEFEEELDELKMDPMKTFVHNPNVKMESCSSSLSSNTEGEPIKGKTHQLIVTSFTSPTKCDHCTALMVGLIRQGYSCQVCGFQCHVNCVNKAPTTCPFCPEQMKGPWSIDAQTGIGTAYEGHVRIRKPAGLKKGWQRAFAVICDFKIFLYDIAEGTRSQPSVIISHVIDMRDEAFSVCSELDSNVAHASQKHVPCIFRITASQFSSSTNEHPILMLAESEREKIKWVKILSELHQFLKKDKLTGRSVYVPKEAFTTTLHLMKTTQAAAIIDPERITLGNEEGLFVVHITKDEIFRLGKKKKVHQIELIAHDRIIAVISGRNRYVRLFHMSALELGETYFCKLEETKDCHRITSGKMRHGTITCLCVAMQRQILCYELCQSKTHQKKLKEIQVLFTVQWMGIFNEQLIVGFQSGFFKYPLSGEESPSKLLNSNDSTLSFLIFERMDALCAVEISCNEYLLCFSRIGIYTDHQGRRSREQELIWPANPSSCCYNAPHLSVYSDNAVDIFDVHSMEWIQTLSLKKARPLNSEGSLNLLGLEKIRLMYFEKKMSEWDELAIPETSQNSQKQMVRNFSKKCRYSLRVTKEERMQRKREMLLEPQMRNKLISNPNNFTHKVSMGLGDGIHIQDDLSMNPHSQGNKTVLSDAVIHHPSITTPRPEPGCSMSASRGLSGLSPGELGSVFTREFFGGRLHFKLKAPTRPVRGFINYERHGPMKRFPGKGL